jgi:hypothetical protein
MLMHCFEVFEFKFAFEFICPQPPPHFLSCGSSHPLSLASFASAARDRKSAGTPSTPLLSSLSRSMPQPSTANDPASPRRALGARSRHYVGTTCHPLPRSVSDPDSCAARSPPRARLPRRDPHVKASPWPYLWRHRHPRTLPRDP